MKTLKKIKTSLIAALVTLIAAPTFTSCLGDDDSDGGFESVSLVTYDGNVDSKARFTLVPEGDAPTKTIIADKAITDNIPVGQRMVIRYTENSSMSDGYLTQVTLRGYNVISTVIVETKDSETAKAANAEMAVNAINRTGKYINLEPYLPLYTERTYAIYADESTLNNPMPDLYVTTATKGEYQGIKQVDLVSFDISMIWSRIDCEGVRIHINNINSTQNVFEFKKNLIGQ